MLAEVNGAVLTPAAPVSLGAADTDAIAAAGGLINKAREIRS